MFARLDVGQRLPLTAGQEIERPAESDQHPNSASSSYLLNDALRGVMLDGNGLLATGPELLVLAAWGAGSFGVALRIFRWR